MSQSIPPQQSIAMATPIQTLPLQGKQTAPSQSQESSADLADPMVADVLNEMEKEVSYAKQSNLAPPVYPSSPQLYPLAPPPSIPSMQYGVLKKDWIHMDNLKRALVCMLLSAVLFNQSWIFPSIYRRIERLSFLESYDFYIRVFLFGMFLYVLLTYVPYP